MSLLLTLLSLMIVFTTFHGGDVDMDLCGFDKLFFQLQTARLKIVEKLLLHVKQVLSRVSYP